MISDIEDDALDLLTKLLEYDPDKRLSASQALAHPYFKELTEVFDEDPAP